MRTFHAGPGVTILLGLMIGGHAMAGQLFEDFESYPIGTGVNEIGHGWGAYDGVAGVTNIAFTNLTETRVAYVEPQATITNAVNVSEVSRLWTEFWLGESNHVDVSFVPPVDTNAVFFAAISTNGYLFLYNPALTNWEECTTDVWNHAAARSTSAWTRVTVMQDFATHQLAFLVDDRLVRQQVSFINTNINAYSRFQVANGRLGNVYLDEVLISNALRNAGARLDLDHDGRPEVDEVALYGDATSWNGVAVTGRVATAHGTVSPSGLIHVPYQGLTNFTFAATSSAYVVDYVLTNGVVATSNAAAVKTGSFTWSNIVAEASVLQVHFRYDGTRYVPGEYGNLSDALAAAQADDRIVVGSGVYAETLQVNSNITLIGTNVAGLISLQIGTGVVATLSGFTNVTINGEVTIGTNAAMVVSNCAVTFGSLDIQANGSLQVVNGTLTVNGATVSGTFTYGQDWNTTVKVMPLNFVDGFEAYGVGSRVDALKGFGWSASDPGDLVAIPPVRASASTNAVLVPPLTTVSNSVDGTGDRIWTDIYLWETNRVAEPPYASVTNGGPAIMAFVGTNGYLTVFNRDVAQGWDTCSNDVWGLAVPPVTSDWTRLSWMIDYSQSQSCFFVNGYLVREKVPLVGSPASYHGFRLESGTGGDVYLDSVSIKTNIPVGLTRDGDLDGMPDAVEVHLHNSVFVFDPGCGSVFLVR